jgi:IS605 OrfB family transposase
MKEAGWVTNWLRRAARRIVHLAVEKKAAIYFMDLVNIRKRVEEGSDLPDYVRERVHQAPWFKLRIYIQEAAAKAGIPVHLYKPYYHTKRCPHCGDTSSSNPNYDRWRFVCGKCGYTGHLDRIGIENAFVDLGHTREIQLPPSSDYEKVARLAEEQREMNALMGLDKATRERSGDAKSGASKNQGGKGGRGRRK